MTPVDGCARSFEEIATDRLPMHFRELEKSIDAPRKSSAMARVRKVSPLHLSTLDLANDFSGCYVFIEDSKPIYVGISRGVVQRIMQHVHGARPNQASLAYRMAAAERWPTGPRPTIELAMQDERMAQLFMDAKAKLATMSVATVQIECPVELCLFEVYAAMRLGTGVHNSFRTH